MLQRTGHRSAIERALSSVPVCLLVGARQTGKTTLARTFVEPGSERYFDLENPVDLARLDEPMLALGGLEGLVVIDEVQRRPDLFEALRVLVDRSGNAARFLILGSASPSALRQSSESLAGRVEVIELGGFGLSTVDLENINRLWVRGGYPRSFLAPDDDASRRWRENYVRTLANRDLPDFGLALPAAMIERFLSLVAHNHGQLWNSAPIARSLGIGESTVRRYLDALDDALLARILPPWHVNVGKRQVKSPKVYLRDSGLVHWLVGVDNRVDLLRHPVVGASWEGLVVEHLIRRHRDLTPYFWRTSNGAELDLLFVRGTKRIAYEIKRSDAPKLTSSMRSAVTDLDLTDLVIVYPGDREYRLSEQVRVIPLASLIDRVGG